jgi:hypothetical protein
LEFVSFRSLPNLAAGGEPPFFTASRTSQKSATSKLARRAQCTELACCNKSQKPSFANM